VIETICIKGRLPDCVYAGEFQVAAALKNDGSKSGARGPARVEPNQSTLVRARGKTSVFATPLTRGVSHRSAT
jgi:hypothetical protein